MPKRPRVLTLYLRGHYRHNFQGDSSEWMAFGNGLWQQLGYEEVYCPLELLDPDRIRAHGPYDIAFYVPYQENAALIRDLVGDVPLIAWLSDCGWRWDWYAREVLPYVDYAVSCDPSSPARYATLGLADKIIVSNWGCRAEWGMYADVLQAKFPAACFTGLQYGERKQLLNRIKEAGIGVQAQDTQARWTPLAPYFDQMARNQFTLCLTRSSHGIRQFKQRHFEPQIFGSILVTEPVPGLEDYWTPGEDCLLFESPEDAVDQMLSLTPKQAAQMAGAARERALNEHTYVARFKAILEQVEHKRKISQVARVILPDAPGASPEEPPPGRLQVTGEEPLS